MSFKQSVVDWLLARLGRAADKTYLTRVLAFGFKYLKPYLHRFVTGLLLGILFGSLNGAFVGASYLLVSRLSPKESFNPRGALLSSVTSSTAAKPDTATEAPSLENKKKEEPTGKQKLRAYAERFGAPFKPVTDRLIATGLSLKSSAQSFYINHIDPWLPLTGRELDWKQIMGGFLILPILAALRGGLGYASSYCMAWTSQRVVMDLKADVFNKLNTLSLDFFNGSTTASILARINGDTAALNGCLRLGLSDLVKEPISIVGIFISLLICDWQLTILAVIFVPLMLIPMRIISKKIRKIAHSAYELDLKQGSLLMDAFANIRIVQAFGLQDQQRTDFIAQNRRGMRMGLRTLQAKEILNPIIELFAAIILSMVIIFVFATGRSAATFMAFAVSLGMFFTPFKKLAGIHLYFVQTEVPLKRLMELFAMEPTVKDPVNPVPLRSFKQGIRLRNLSFHYNPEKPVLRNVNIDVPRGKKIGLAGESGSGKSTLVNLLFRFYDPTSGTLEMDGTDFKKLSLAEMRSHMALVSQDVLLFNASVADNIGFGKIGATRDEIIAAAKSAYAHDFIMNMPEGYDTPIGERGVLISGGQRQRLAIARAFVRNAPILVLDEATASLDSQAEAEVQIAIDSLATGRTVVCVAHRLSTLASMDKIYVMKDGEVIEEGGFEELLRKQGAFATMAKRQSITAQAEV